MPYTVNAYQYQITSGSEAMYNLKQALSSSGWKVSGSSNAVVFSANADILVSGAMLETSGAWFTVVAPDDTRQWSFQRGTNNQTWTILRSKAGMSGSVAATTPPSDGQAANLANGVTIFQTAAPFTWLVSTISSSTVDQISSSFYAFSVSGSSNVVPTVIYDEALLTGSYNSLDQDPFVSFTGYRAAGFTIAEGSVQFDSSIYNALGANRSFKRVRHNMPSPANQGSSHFGYYSQADGNVIIPTSTAIKDMNTSPYDSKETITMAAYGRSNAGTYSYSGFWGYATNVKYLGTGASRTSGQTMNTGTKYFILAAGLWFPWDSSTPL